MTTNRSVSCKMRDSISESTKSGSLPLWSFRQNGQITIGIFTDSYRSDSSDPLQASSSSVRSMTSSLGPRSEAALSSSICAVPTNFRCSDCKTLIFTFESLKNVAQWPGTPIPHLRLTQRLTGQSPQQLAGY